VWQPRLEAGHEARRGAHQPQQQAWLRQAEAEPRARQELVPQERPAWHLPPWWQERAQELREREPPQASQRVMRPQNLMANLKQQEFRERERLRGLWRAGPAPPQVRGQEAPLWLPPRPLTGPYPLPVRAVGLEQEVPQQWHPLEGAAWKDRRGWSI
jgi:hypothetical protein